MLLLVFILLLLVGCGVKGGSRVSSNDSPVLVQTIPLLNVNGLNGNGSIVAMSYTDTSSAGATTGFKETLKIYQQDDVNPDLLLELSSVYLGIDALSHRLADITVNGRWATVTMNDNNGPRGWVALVRMSNPALSAIVTVPATPDRAVAAGNWLLVAFNTNISLYDITNPASPVLKSTYALSAGTTSIAALPSGFFVITNNGYGYMNCADPRNIVFSETADVNIKQSRKSYVIGNKLYIGGPSKYAGKAKIARVDVTTPGTPKIEIFNDQIVGTFVDFSYDYADSYYLQMADSVKLYRETDGVLSLNQSVSLTSFTGSASQMHAYKGRFHIGKWGMNVYKMP